MIPVVTRRNAPPLTRQEREDAVASWLQKTAEYMIDEGAEAAVLCTSQPDGSADFTVLVPQDQLGKIVGKQGRSVRALRLLAIIFGAKHGIRYGFQVKPCDFDESFKATRIPTL